MNQSANNGNSSVQIGDDMQAGSWMGGQDETDVSVSARV
jgi:hypothetical protein